MWYKLKNITKKDREYVDFLKGSLGDGTNVNIYELNKTTRIVYSDNGIDKHASISNHTREVKEVEIHFVAEKIMELTHETIRVQKSITGLVHLHFTLKEETLIQ